jgi:hypothetical protein
MFNFNLKDAELIKIVRLQKLGILKFLDFFRNTFLFLFFASIVFFGISYFKVLSISASLKTSIIFW